MLVNKRGTWCIVIDKQIAVATCPIQSCTYRNLVNNLCTYEQSRDYDANALAAATARPQLDADQQQEIRNKIATDIKAALSNPS